MQSSPAHRGTPLDTAGGDCNTTGAPPPCGRVTISRNVQTTPIKPPARTTPALTIALFALFAFLPGPARSPFSGIPLSTKAHLTLAVLIVLVTAFALFRPRGSVRARWIVAIAVACVAKLLLMPLVVDEGWLGRYSIRRALTNPSPHLSDPEPIRFYRRGVQPARVDRTIDVTDVRTGLFYVNDWPDWNEGTDRTPRHIVDPLHVEWTGHTDAGSGGRLTGTVSAAGDVSFAVDGRVIAKLRNPQSAAIDTMLAPGARRLSVVYDKPASTKPLILVTLSEHTITPIPAAAAAVARGRLAASAIDILGLLAFVALAFALADAYRPVGIFLTDEMWQSPDRVALTALVAIFILIATYTALTQRGATVPLGKGDDPLTYEGAARLVLFNGPRMIENAGDAKPYFFYPLYSYALAGAHAFMGEDYGTIRFFNWLCLAATAVVLWRLLRGLLTDLSVVIVLAAFGVFTGAYLALYATVPFSDNLFVPLAMATVLAGAIAFERSSSGWLFITGVLTALGAATRPSLMLHVPVFLLTILLFWRGNIVRRAAGAAMFAGGFAAGVSPFTLRNWIVAHRFVLLISSFVMLPMFLWAPGDTSIPISRLVASSQTLGGAVRTFFAVFASRPGYSMWIELRKVLFTLGFTALGSPGSAAPRLLILFPIAFLVAAFARRIPRAQLIATGSFAVSHLVAMVVAAPWTYGYKTILPFDLALLAGAAFLLPRRGDAIVRPAEIPRSIPSHRHSVSVVLPTYNEKDSIRQVILDFFATGVVDEVVVINNNAAAGTSEEVAGTGAREVIEPRQGYGAAMQRGLREAMGSLIVVCEPDGTFLARDIFKLLAYADDFDVVYGSRTFQPLVWHGANMGFFLRFGNWSVAKYMQLIFNAPSLSDVGCTYRLIRRDVAMQLEPHFRIAGSQFGPEMMALSLRHGYRVAQIPLNYTARVGVSSVTGDPGKAFRLGLQMIWLITSHRIKEAMRRPDQSATAVRGSEQTATMNS